MPTYVEPAYAEPGLFSWPDTPFVQLLNRWLAELTRWRPGGDLREFDATRIMQTLPVPTEKTGRILVLEDAVRSLGQSVQRDPKQ